MTDATPFDAVDLFAGPGGWDVGARRLGLYVLGFEYDDAANLTRAAAGHATVVGDLAAVDPRLYPARGQIASPPCDGFSPAGKGKAREDTDRLLAALEDVRTHSDIVALIADARGWMTHEGTALVLEPLRWALANTPTWLAWEQVRTVRPLWEACAVILRRIGYTVTTGLVHAEQYGVPQARERAVLLARAPWHPGGPVAMPEPTHSLYHRRNPEKLDAGVKRWITVAEALEALDPDDNEYEPTPANAPDTVAACHWVYMRPSVTIVGSYAPDVLAAPGWRKPGDGPRQKARGSVRITLEQAAALQTFPADYPWQGSVSKRWQQVGNAVPPMLAEALLAAVV